MRRVLVTGGGGYVGSRLVPKLLEEHFAVRVLDTFLFLPGIFQQFAGNPHLEVVKADIRDHAAVEQCLDGVDAIIHLAAISNDPSGELDPPMTYAVNYDATCYLVETAKQHGVRRFIFASSASVYGFTEETASEEHRLQPQSTYALSKALAEPVVCGLCDADFTTVVTRAATLCGSSARMRLDLVVHTLVYQALNGSKLTVFGGDQERPLLGLADLVRAYVLLLDADASVVGGQVFNIGYGSYRIMQIAEIVRQVLGSDIAFDVAPTVDVRSYAISCDKVRNSLGFTPFQTIEDAVLEVKQCLEKLAIDDPNSPVYNNARMLARLRA